MWSIIRYLHCGNFDRWSVQSPENLSGYRKDWYEKILWRTHGSHPWQFPDGSVLQCGLSVLWTQKEYDESPLFWPGWIVLLQKRLDNGKFQWARNASEVRPLTRQEFRWLMEGLSIDQPKAIQPAKDRDYWFVQYVDFEKFFYSRSRLLTEDIHRCEIMGCVVRG